MNTARHREVESLAQHQRAVQWQGQDSTSGTLGPKYLFLKTLRYPVWRRDWGGQSSYPGTESKAVGLVTPTTALPRFLTLHAWAGLPSPGSTVSCAGCHDRMLAPDMTRSTPPIPPLPWHLSLPIPAEMSPPGFVPDSPSPDEVASLGIPQSSSCSRTALSCDSLVPLKPHPLGQGPRLPFSPQNPSHPEHRVGAH